RHLHGGVAVVPRAGHPAAHAGLGSRHLTEHLRGLRRLLVGGAVRRGRDREPGDRHQPRRGRDRVGGGGMRPAEPRPDALVVDHLDVAYTVRGRRRPAVRDVSLRITPGQAYGLVGESGCGKSTIAPALVDYSLWNGGMTVGLGPA